MMPFSCPVASSSTHHLVITFLVLTAAAFVAGIINALAGGGSLVTFPALLFAGLNPIEANASSIVALISGTFSGAWAYRDKIKGVTEVNVTAFLVISVVGGLVGALLLLWTPSSIFAGLVPWLTLFSTVVFAAGNFAPLELIRRLNISPRAAVAVHFIISIYGGYFGGGIGFLLLATLTLYGMRDINAMNGLKMILVGLMTVTSMLTFASANIVAWPETLPMLVSSLIGGYVGAHGAKLVDQQWIKGFVIVLGVGLTIYFFWHGV
jgi:uncharacterized membrane protein YfcA